MSVDTAALFKCDAVLFDCDGVLVDSEVIATRALHQSLLDINQPMTIDEVADTFTGQSFLHCVAMIEERLGYTIPDDFIANNRRYFREMMEKELVPMPGIKTVLEALKLPFAVVTNSQKRELDIKLTHTGLDQFFLPARRFDTQTLGVAKPDPEIYKLAAASMGMDITRCLIIEDSLPGVTAGVGSGAKVWAYRPHLTAEQLASFGITQVLADWSEFLTLFEQTTA